MDCHRPSDSRSSRDLCMALAQYKGFLVRAGASTATGGAERRRLRSPDRILIGQCPVEAVLGYLWKTDGSSQPMSKRSAFITFVHAATKSFTNFSFESAHA